MTNASEASRTAVATGPVHRAFTLLQAVVAAGAPIGVRELARRTGQPKSTVARLLATLDELGMVERSADGSALPGSALATLNNAVGRPTPLVRDRLRPLLGELVDRFGETAAIGVDAGDRFLYLAAERGPSAVQVPDPSGQSYLFHTIAPGLVAMATWSPERLRSYLAAPLAAPTEHTMTSATQLRRRLAAARRVGFVWTDQELDLEVNGVATPVFDDDGTLVAVVSLYGPAYRLSSAVTPEVGPILAEMVRARSQVLLAGA